MTELTTYNLQPTTDMGWGGELLAKLREDPKATHISPNSLQTFEKCGMSWFYNYVHPRRWPWRSAVIALGSAIDEAIQLHLLTKLLSLRGQYSDDIEESTVEELCEKFRDEWHHQISDEQSVDSKGNLKVPVRFREDEDPGRLLDVGVDCIRVWHEYLAPEIEPFEVQPELTSPIVIPRNGNGRGRLEGEVLCGFLGKPDVIETSGAITDVKTWGQNKCPVNKKTNVRNLRWLRESLQMAGYTYGYLQKYGELPSAIRYAAMIKAKGGVVPDMPSMVPEMWQAHWFIDRVVNMLETVRAGRFNPAESGHWLCTEKFCQWWEICDHRAGRTVFGQTPEVPAAQFGGEQFEIKKQAAQLSQNVREEGKDGTDGEPVNTAGFFDFANYSA